MVPTVSGSASISPAELSAHQDALLLDRRCGRCAERTSALAARPAPSLSLSQIAAEFLAKCPPEQVESMRFACEPREYFACRVLRARKFDVDAALALVKETSAWRAEMKVDELRSKAPAELLGGTTEDELQVRSPALPARARRCTGAPSRALSFLRVRPFPLAVFLPKELLYVPRQGGPARVRRARRRRRCGGDVQ